MNRTLEAIAQALFLSSFVAFDPVRARMAIVWCTIPVSDTRGEGHPWRPCRGTLAWGERIVGFVRALAVTICLTAWAVVAFFLYATLSSGRDWPGQSQGIWAMVFALALLGMGAYGCTKIGRRPAANAQPVVARKRYTQHRSRTRRTALPSAMQSSARKQLPTRRVVLIILVPLVILLIVLGASISLRSGATNQTDEIVILANPSTSGGDALGSVNIADPPAPVLFFLSANSLELIRTDQLPPQKGMLSLVHFYEPTSAYIPFELINLKSGRMVYPVAGSLPSTTTDQMKNGLIYNANRPFLGRDPFYIGTQSGDGLYFDLMNYPNSSASVDGATGDLVVQRLDHNGNAVGPARPIDLDPPGSGIVLDPHVLGVYSHVDLLGVHVIGWNDTSGQTTLTEIDDNGSVLRRSRVPAVQSIDEDGWILLGITKQIASPSAELWAFDYKQWSLRQIAQFTWTAGTTISNVSQTSDFAFMFVAESEESKGTIVHVIDTKDWVEHVTVQFAEGTDASTPFCVYRDRLYLTLLDGRAVSLASVGIDGGVKQSAFLLSHLPLYSFVRPLAIAPNPQNWHNRVWNTACDSVPVVPGS